MSLSEQKRLYEHFTNLSKNGLNEIQRTNAKGYAEEILASYPQFEVKEEVKEEPVSDSDTSEVKEVEVKPKSKKEKKK